MTATCLREGQRSGGPPADVPVPEWIVAVEAERSVKLKQMEQAAQTDGAVRQQLFNATD